MLDDKLRSCCVIEGTDISSSGRRRGEGQRQLTELSNATFIVVVNIPAIWKQTICFFNMAERHHTSTTTWQHSWFRKLPERRLGWGFPLPVARYHQNWHFPNSAGEICGGWAFFTFHQRL